MKRCLEDKKPKKNNEEEAQERTYDGCKWVKTDSECKFTFTFIVVLMSIVVEVENIEVGDSDTD